MALSIGRKAQAAVPSIKDPEIHVRRVLDKLRKYFRRGPVLAVKLGGDYAFMEVRRVTGYTDLAIAEKGTIRGDPGLDSIKRSTAEERALENLVYTSGNLDEVKTG